MTQKIADILRSYQITFDQNPWYGKSIMGILKDVDIAKINHKPAGAPHSIFQLVKHMITWRNFAIMRLDQDPGYQVKMDSEEDWTNVKEATNESWEALIKEFKASQEKLMQILSSKELADLKIKMPKSDYTFLEVVEGVVQHDIYHLGQIAMLNKMG